MIIIKKNYVSVLEIIERSNNIGNNNLRRNYRILMVCNVNSHFKFQVDTYRRAYYCSSASCRRVNLRIGMRYGIQNKYYNGCRCIHHTRN